MQTAKEWREQVERGCSLGPFGRYNKGSLGHILNSLDRYYNVPLHIVENVVLSDKGTLCYNNKPFGIYKYFDEIEVPLVNFCDKDYNSERYIVSDEQKLFPRLYISLVDSVNPGLYIHNSFYPERTRQFLIDGMGVGFDGACPADISAKPNAYLTAKEITGDKNILVKFCKTNGIYEWIDYLNNNFSIEISES